MSSMGTQFMGTQFMGSTPACETPREQRYDAQAWPRDPMDSWGVPGGIQPGSEPYDSDLFRSIDDFIQFPVTPSVEQPGLSYSFDTSLDASYSLDASGIQTGSAPSSQQVEFTSSINPPESFVTENAHDPAATAGPADLELPLQNESPAVPSMKTKALVPNPKKRGRKRKGPFTPAEQVVQRKKFLERNRSAATRCRHRKKQEIEDLKERHMELQRTNTQLVYEGYELARELESLNSMVMSCGSCSRRKSLAIDNVRGGGTAFSTKSRALSDGAVMSTFEDGGADDVSSVSGEQRSTFSSCDEEEESSASGLSPHLAADKLDR